MENIFLRPKEVIEMEHKMFYLIHLVVHFLYEVQHFFHWVLFSSMLFDSTCIGCQYHSSTQIHFYFFPSFSSESYSCEYQTLHIYSIYFTVSLLDSQQDEATKTTVKAKRVPMER
jgi:hypothetical protein